MTQEEPRWEILRFKSAQNTRIDQEMLHRDVVTSNEQVKQLLTRKGVCSSDSATNSKVTRRDGRVTMVTYGARPTVSSLLR